MGIDRADVTAFARMVNPSVTHDSGTQASSSAGRALLVFRETTLKTAIAGSIRGEGIVEHFTRFKR